MTGRRPAFGLALGLALLPVAVSCKKSAPRATAGASASARPPAPKYDRIPRHDFNRRAVELALPLFWRRDADGDKTLDPDELALVWLGSAPKAQEWLDASGAFTPSFAAAYERATKPLDFTGLDEAEKKRRETVARELAQGRPTLLESDFSKAPASHRTLVRHLLTAAARIERLHAMQRGTLGLDRNIPPDDTLSRALFFRNQGPFCLAPATENDPDCNALASRPKPSFGLYPAELQTEPKFCEKLERAPNAKELTGHFSIVRPGAEAGTYKAVWYSEAFFPDMQAVAKELDAAARALEQDEAALKEYLVRAANAFRNDSWESADEAWAAMNAENSKYYLRVAPDEVYYEPCAWKAGFALTFARINKDSLAWQAKLEPVKQAMEDELARLAGPPYAARRVKFKLPDFIDIVLNAGDSRAHLGGTIGQSLPNWGKVAAAGGRTVTMTNLDADPDSRTVHRATVASLYCAATMNKLPESEKPEVMSVVLHEAGHNLGPSHEYAVNGKVDDAVFGGPLASTLEELKAQTIALYFPAWLLDKKLVTRAEADHSRLRDVAWGFGHVSRGMYDPDGKPKNYSHLASIQLGFLRQAGVLEWKPEQKAANGQDVGCFEVHLDEWQPALESLAKLVLSIKSKGDRRAAEKLVAEHVDAKDDWSKLRDVIRERWLRTPRASYLYAIRL